MMWRLTHTGRFAVASVVWLAATFAGGDVIYVAPKDSPDYAAAQAKPGAVVERTLHAALARAAELLNQPGARTVAVMVAQGEDDGKAGAGVWEIPTIKNPQGVLVLLGGYSDGFTKRDPFDTMTLLKTSSGRSGAFISLGAHSELKEYVISGFVMDGSPSNAYDDRSNSFTRSGSRTYPILSFGWVKTDHLLIADNVFLNGGHGVFDPALTPGSPDAVVEIQNNFFLNNIKPLQIGASINPSREVRLRGNTFLLNWPYNPDPDSSNVGAVMLHNSSSAQHLLIEGNLFAYNIGGAMQHDWPENRMPKMTIRNNLFFKNAILFGNEEPGAGVIAGKFGLNPRYLVLDLDTIEEDFGYTVEGNVVADPGLEVSLDLKVEPDDEDVELNGYAPKMELAIPIPSNEAARGYGARAENVLQFSEGGE